MRKVIKMKWQLFPTHSFWKISCLKTQFFYISQSVFLSKSQTFTCNESDNIISS